MMNWMIPIGLAPVLIETLWNVKLNRKDYIFDITNVLIETLWNVKLLLSPVRMNAFPY